MTLRPGIAAAVAAAVVLGAVSTLGDWIWARFLTDGSVAAGAVHGLLVFVVLALVLGAAAGSRRATGHLLATLPPAGLLLAFAFYPLAAVAGYLGALLLTWIAMWLTLAILLRWAREGTESRGRALARGAVGALASGLAFWAVSGMWTGAEPVPYALRLLYWTAAFLPGFLALLAGRSPLRVPPRSGYRRAP